MTKGTQENAVFLIAVIGMLLLFIFLFGNKIGIPTASSVNFEGGVNSFFTNLGETWQGLGMIGRSMIFIAVFIMVFLAFIYKPEAKQT